jgi:hypothetical protein
VNLRGRADDRQAIAGVDVRVRAGIGLHVRTARDGDNGRARTPA